MKLYILLMARLFCSALCLWDLIHVAEWRNSIFIFITVVQISPHYHYLSLYCLWIFFFSCFHFSLQIMWLLTFIYMTLGIHMYKFLLSIFLGLKLLRHKVWKILVLVPTKKIPKWLYQLDFHQYISIPVYWTSLQTFGIFNL